MHPTQKPASTLEDTEALHPADTLRAAATYLERHGWTRTTYYEADRRTPTPAACVLGAISIVVYGEPVSNPNPNSPQWCYFNGARALLVTHLHGDIEREDFNDELLVFRWNDAPGRTAGQVIQTLRTAAEDYDRAHPAGGAA